MKPLRIAVLVAASVLAAMVVRVVLLRVTFPYELEWMCGSILDHVDRVRAGAPVYTEPSTRWIPFLYPPLYYWLAAPLGGSFLACRLLSLASTVVQAACVGWLARSAGATRYWSAVAVLLVIGAFFYVGYWYDIERSDTLCVALVLLANVLLERRRTRAGAALAGATLGLAFLAKQQALPFLAAASLALVLRRERLRAVLTAGVGGAVILAATWWQDRATGGWFSYYVWKMPIAHGLDVRLWRDVVRYDLVEGAVLFASASALGALLLRDAWRGDRTHLLFAAMLLAGAATSLSSRLHLGGWRNTLEFGTGYACAGLGVLASRVEPSLEGHRARALVPVAILVQLALWVRPLDERVPDATLRRDTARLLATVSRLEESGEVLVVGRGHLTHPAHFQMSALADVVKMDGAPPDLLDALRGRRLAAIVDDARALGEERPPLWPPVMLEDVEALRSPLFANYYVAERVDDAAGRLAMPILTSPRWVYRPRSRPLQEGDAEILPRHYEEMRLAERRSASLASGKSAPYSSEEIERLAATAVSR